MKFANIYFLPATSLPRAAGEKFVTLKTAAFGEVARGESEDGNDRPNTEFLRMLKAIAKRAGVADAELHTFRRTYATTLLRNGVGY